MPFAEAFLILPTVLHAQVRESLPGTITTSLANWVGENPVSRAIIADRARALVPFTKEAMTFGGMQRALSIDRGGLVANPGWKQRLAAVKEESEEVKSCYTHSHFVGRWFARTGDVATVLALLGVRP